MDRMTLIVLIVLLVLFGACLLYVLHYLRANVFNPMGKGAEKATAKVLRRFGGIRGFRTLSDITLSVDGKTAHIENMLIGYFGILLVHTCPVRGEYYGTLDGESWTIHRNDGRDKTTIPNPLTQQREAAALLRALFSRNQVYKVPIDSVVYRTSPSAKAALYITNNGEILAPGKLRSYLGKTKFEKDLGLDVAKLAELVQGASA